MLFVVAAVYLDGETGDQRGTISVTSPDSQGHSYLNRIRRRAPSGHLADVDAIKKR